MPKILGRKLGDEHASSFAKNINIDTCFEEENPNGLEMLIMYPYSGDLSMYVKICNQLGRQVYFATMHTKTKPARREGKMTDEI